MKTLRLALRITNIFNIILSIVTIVYILVNWKTLSECDAES